MKKGRNTPEPIADRLLSKIAKNAVSGEWTAAVTNKGYGKLQLHTGKTGGKTGSAHRLSWMEFKGAIPLGQCVLHRCDNPKCINPEHLFLGTKKDNSQDCLRKGRWPSREGEKGASAKLTNAAIRLMRLLRAEGWTQCRLAQRFSITQSAVSRAVRGKTWGNVLS